MDFLTKAYSQVVDALRPMSPAKITTVLLLVAVAASLVYLFRYESGTADEYIFGAQVLDDGEIRDATAAFAAKGLNDWDVKGNRVLVPRGKRSEYLAAASEANALPVNSKSIWEGSLNEKFWTSSESRRRQEKWATKRELEQMLKEMPDVSYASVQFKEKRKPGLLGEVESHALVAVRAQNKRSLNGELVETIRSSAASALGMDPESVTVTDIANGRAYRGGKHGSAALAQSAYLNHKEMLEASFEKKIYDQLSTYPDVIVNVNVDIEREMQSETNSVRFSDPASYETNNFSEEQTTQNVAVGGAPGSAANGLPNTSATVASSSRGPSNTKSVTREQSRAIVGRETTRTVLAPFTPTKITAAITLPDTYPISVWKSRNPPVEGEDAVVPDEPAIKAIEEETKKNIQELVKNLLPPVPPGADPYPEIVVAFTPQLPVAVDAPPSTGTLIGFWLGDHWQSIALLVAALAGLVFLRGMVKSSQISAATAPPALQLATAGAGSSGGVEDDLGDEDDEDDDAERGGVLRAQFQAGGPNLQEELSELVREDPDSAANVLRAWIGDAA